MKNLDPKSMWVFRFQAYIVLALLLFWAFLATSVRGSSALLVLLVIIILIGEIYARLAYNFWKYDLTKSEIKIENGIIWKTYKSVPYQRVQNVDINRGILARIFGFSAVAVQTAGYSGSGGRGIFGGAMGAEAYFPGVSVNDAEKIRKLLLSKIGKRSGM